MEKGKGDREKKENGDRGAGSGGVEGGNASKTVMFFSKVPLLVSYQGHYNFSVFSLCSSLCCFSLSNFLSVVSRYSFFFVPGSSKFIVYRERGEGKHTRKQSAT